MAVCSGKTARDVYSVWYIEESEKRYDKGKFRY